MTSSINYTKIIMGMGMIVFIAALVAGATGAFFNDTETSTGNVFTAGAIDLLVDSEAHYNGMVCQLTDSGYIWVFPGGRGNPANNPAPGQEPHLWGEPCNGTWEETDLGPEHQFFNFSDLKPGDQGENTLSLHVYDNDAYACVIIDNMQDNDNDCNEPELEAEGDAYGEGNETCGDPGEGEGELSDEIHFFAWNDNGGSEPGNNIWEDGEAILFSNVSGPASDVIDGVVYPLFTPFINNGAVLQGTTTTYIGLYWCYGDIEVDEVENTLDCSGENATNITQTDSLSADITFYVEQARNNEDFQCPVLDQPVETTLTLAKAVLPPEVALDTDFTLSADGPTPISGVEGNTVITSAVVSPGDYDLSEVGGPGGETSIEWECSGNATPETDNGDGTASVTIAEGEDVVCGVTNNYPDNS